VKNIEPPESIRDASVKVRDNIINSKIQTIAFINKRAISAGVLISLAADIIIMAPGATIGASTPVNFLGETASEKVISYWSAEMRATAERNKRPVRIAEAMVDQSLEIIGLIDKGKLLTLTTEEALKYKIADHKAEGVNQVLKIIGMPGAQVIQSPTLMDNLSEWLEPWVIWFLIGLALLLLEFSIPGVIFFFFGIGAWITAFITLFRDISLNTQLAIFIISSVMLLIFLRKWLKTVFVGRTIDENIPKDFDEYVGEKTTVIEEITKNKKGKVEFRGSIWDAESNETIPAGTAVEIIGRNNITLVVKPLI